MGVLYGSIIYWKSFEPYIVGGDTVATQRMKVQNSCPPGEIRGRLQNYAGIIGSGAAVDYISDVGLSNIEEHESRSMPLSQEA